MTDKFQKMTKGNENTLLTEIIFRLLSWKTVTAHIYKICIG